MPLLARRGCSTHPRCLRLRAAAASPTSRGCRGLDRRKPRPAVRPTPAAASRRAAPGVAPLWHRRPPAGASHPHAMPTASRRRSCARSGAQACHSWQGQGLPRRAASPVRASPARASPARAWRAPRPAGKSNKTTGKRARVASGRRWRRKRRCHRRRGRHTATNAHTCCTCCTDRNAASRYGNTTSAVSEQLACRPPTLC
mmetsp:Transcript_110780/g.318370  ORF Transcript_110780/g.318370 Transcript_110780/m.318370 type:complete len:200 (-) Transcript_110780:1893-2492(-)